RGLISDHSPSVNSSNFTKSPQIMIICYEDDECKCFEMGSMNAKISKVHPRVHSEVGVYSPISTPTPQMNFSRKSPLSLFFRACHIIGFDPYFGIYHSDTSGIPSFAYDIIEPYRWIVEKALIENTNKFKIKQDFTLDKNTGIVRLKTSGVDTLLPILYSILAARVPYRNKNYQWTTILQLKLRELSLWLQDPDQKSFTFTRPQPNL
ncbi:MAG: CRISPR-associated endonuclease Cas1, partial [Halobacteriota archaeon]|nr:CRISPR-associated endonuclease Cas1 [Halobacteriota archaeon]